MSSGMISGTSGFPGLETMPTAFLADAGFAMLKMELYRSQKSEVRSRKSEGRSKTAIAECILDCRFWTLILNSDFFRTLHRAETLDFLPHPAMVIQSRRCSRHAGPKPQPALVPRLLVAPQSR